MVKVTWPDQVLDGLPAALIGNVRRLDAREMHQQARGEMTRRAEAPTLTAQFSCTLPGDGQKIAMLQ
jgi:hypothetical protein